MENKTCQTCENFVQHYIRDIGGRYVLIWDGHCKKPRLKPRKAKAPACPYWEERKEAPAKPDTSETERTVICKVSGTLSFVVEGGCPHQPSDGGTASGGSLSVRTESDQRTV